jgi:DNA polymerase-3 subunit alpha (Gram-positive type)
MAYFKVYYPAEFYATYFTTKIEDFNTAAALGGKKAVMMRMELIRSRADTASDKEKNELIVLECVYEMLCRGYEFLPVELGKSRAMQFWEEGGKVRIPVGALEGVGETAARSICDNYDERPFETVEEIQQRAGVNKTAIQALRDYGVLQGLPETDQLCLF